MVVTLPEIDKRGKSICFYNHFQYSTVRYYFTKRHNKDAEKCDYIEFIIPLMI